MTAAEAVAAWQAVRFAPHAMADVTEVRTATTRLGTGVQAPIAVATSTFQRAAHPDGELAMARATAAAGPLMVVWHRTLESQACVRLLASAPYEFSRCSRRCC